MTRKDMREGDVKLIKRVNGLERQYRLDCPECNVFVAYLHFSSAKN